MPLREATPTLSTIAETSTVWRGIPHRLTFFNTAPALRSPTYTLPPMPRPTPPAIRSVQGDCALQAEGYGPIPKYDNILGFHLSPEIHDIAANAATPTGYIQSFAYANGSFVGTNYLGHYGLQLYDTLECARKCNEWGHPVHLTRGGPTNQVDVQIPGQVNATTEIGEDEHARQAQEQICHGFNVYFERSPAIRLGPECREAESRTIIKCALWGEPLRVEGATNIGYREWDFDVAIAGSNGYNLEKYAEVENVALEGKMSKTIIAALFLGQLILMIVAF